MTMTNSLSLPFGSSSLDCSSRSLFFFLFLLPFECIIDDSDVDGKSHSSEFHPLPFLLLRRSPPLFLFLFPPLLFLVPPLLFLFLALHISPSYFILKNKKAQRGMVKLLINERMMMKKKLPR